jgi:hypothetical protein
MRRWALLCFVVACGKPPASRVTIEAPDAATPATSVTPEPAIASDRPPDDAMGHPAVLVPLSPATAYDIGPDTIITLRRTQCYGSCPVYSVGVRSDGSVHFYGRDYTQTNGYASANIGVANVRALLAFMRAKSFATLHTLYLATGTDHPKIIVMLRQGRALKYVERDDGNKTEPALEAVEQEIERVTGAAQWVGPPSSPPRSSQTPVKIPPADFVRMAGARLHEIEKTCALGQTIALKLEIGIDDFGGAVFHGGGYPGTATASFACLRKELPTLSFPLASVSLPSTLTVSLSP